MKKFFALLLSIILFSMPLLSLADEKTSQKVALHSITYKDGADGKVFADQSYQVKEGEETPSFSGEIPGRGDLIFSNWSPSVEKTVTGTITYIAQWKEKTSEIPFPSADQQTVEEQEEAFLNDNKSNGQSGNKLSEVIEYEKNSVDEDQNTSADPSFPASENENKEEPNIQEDLHPIDESPSLDTEKNIISEDTLSSPEVSSRLPEPAATYEIKYVDGSGAGIFEPQVFIANDGDPTPKYSPINSGSNTNHLYFLQWEPKIAETVTGNAEYVAAWFYFDGNWVTEEGVSGVRVKTDFLPSDYTARLEYYRDGLNSTQTENVPINGSHFFENKNNGQSSTVYIYNGNGKLVMGLSFTQGLIIVAPVLLNYDANAPANAQVTGDVPVDANKYYTYDVVEILPPGTLAIEGYTFVNWNTKADGTGISYNPASTENNAFTIMEDTILYAQWEALPTYTITYTDGVNNEEVFADQTYTVDEGTATPAFEGNPVREGYLFKGWTPQVADTVTKDAVYTAQWGPFTGNNAISITIFNIVTEEFLLDAVPFVIVHQETSTTKGPESTSFGAVSFFNLPDGTYRIKPLSIPEGFTFTYVKDAEAWGTQIASNEITVKLGSDSGRDNPNFGDFGYFYTPITYTVTYQSNGGTNIPSETVDYNNPFTKPADPTRNDYIFKGWFTDSQLTAAYNFATIATADITLYAKWEAIPKFTVTYTDGVENETVFADQVSTVNEGTATPAFNGTPSRSGYTFKGWTPAVAPTVTANAVYTAQWEKVISSHTVYFESNGGTYISPYYEVAHGSAISAPKDPVRKGYVFTGWYMEPALKNPWNFKTYGVYNTMTLYAGWKAAAPGSTVPNTGDDGISPYITLSLISLTIGTACYSLFKKSKKRTN